MRALFPVIALGTSFLVAVACGSSDERYVAAAGGDGAAGHEDLAGAPPAGGSSFGNAGGAEHAGDQTDAGGAAGSSFSASSGGVDNGNLGGTGDVGGLDGVGGVENGGAGTDPEVPPAVVALGCFAESGDGWDFVAGLPADLVGTGSACGGREASNDPDGFAPQETPTSFALTRKFVIDDDILSAATLTLSFASDDAASFTLNGHDLGGCMPPTGDIGFCSQSCQSLEFPAEFLLGGGAVNELDIEVVNLLSVDAGGGHFGWTGIAYSVCAATQ